MKFKLIDGFLLNTKRLFKLTMRTFIFLFFSAVFAVSPNSSFSQVKVVIDADKEVTVNEVFKIIKNQTDYTFVYQEGIFKKQSKIQLKKGKVRVDNLLNQIILNSNLDIVVTSGNTILIKEKKRNNKQKFQVL
ncbi:hypothetical protein JL193_10535 [Polaribacter batillariae]|uniref:Secretin/TonB short N-terminal domain-containing protein n=1 Tax=Polaribacter batillariae TaxID=2808900 RepID=A0ABX7SR16_9FLAO|nr:hypothetical protein [Polaribacter batillariae]QTD36581.1 hypothetical protein JL193_10535 [Polaribacter batillariae]